MHLHQQCLLIELLFFFFKKKTIIIEKETKQNWKCNHFHKLLLHNLKRIITHHVQQRHFQGSPPSTRQNRIAKKENPSNKKNYILGYIRNTTLKGDSKYRFHQQNQHTFQCIVQAC